MSNFKRLSLMSAAACGLMTATAVAQTGDYYNRDKYEAVTDRAQPDFDPEPVRLGAFLVDSQADLGLTATDNVFASNGNTESGVIARIGVSASARSDWNVHMIGADVSAYRNEYLDFGDESINDLRLRGVGRLDVSREVSIGAQVFAEDRAEPRTDFANAIGVDRPVQFTRTGGAIDVNYQNDRVRWNNSIGATTLDYDDGRLAGTNVPVDQDFRDYSVTEARSRLSYALSPNVAVFAQGTVAQAEYDNPQLIAGALRSRDSSGYTAAAGVDFELDALVRGDIAVGYFSEDKDDDFFSDVDGLSVDARMQWFPTRLTTVGFTAGRRVLDLGQIESPSALATQFGARVDHELRRNVIVSAFGNIDNLDYQEIDRTDENYEIGVMGTYKMNKRVHLEVFARHLERNATGSAINNLFDPSYDTNLIGVGLSLHP